MKKVTYYLVSSLTILSFLIGSIFLFQKEFKILLTADELRFISEEIEWYNGQKIKTDGMTERVEELMKRRREIYNSDDIVIRIFCKQHSAVKILILILDTYLIILTIFMWLYQIAEVMRKRRRRARRRKKIA